MSMKNKTIQYGIKLDCAKNGCDPPHRDDGLVVHWDPVDGPPPLDETQQINNHAASWVYREISAWESLQPE